MDFRDINVATPKDMYVMPIVDMLVDSIAKYEHTTIFGRPF